MELVFVPIGCGEIAEGHKKLIDRTDPKGEWKKVFNYQRIA